MISREAFKVSWIYEDGLEDGKAIGKAEGKAEGKLEAIRITLSTRFPGLDFALELDQIRSIATLDEVFASILVAQSPEEVRTIISTAAKSQGSAGLQ